LSIADYQRKQLYPFVLSAVQSDQLSESALFHSVLRHAEGGKTEPATLTHLTGLVSGALESGRGEPPPGLRRRVVDLPQAGAQLPCRSGRCAPPRDGQGRRLLVAHLPRRRGRAGPRPPPGPREPQPQRHRLPAPLPAGRRLCPRLPRRLASSSGPTRRNKPRALATSYTWRCGGGRLHALWLWSRGHGRTYAARLGWGLRGHGRATGQRGAGKSRGGEGKWKAKERRDGEKKRLVFVSQCAAWAHWPDTFCFVWRPSFFHRSHFRNTRNTALFITNVLIYRTFTIPSVRPLSYILFYLFYAHAIFLFSRHMSNESIYAHAEGK
jgi:hypothetical protein